MAKQVVFKAIANEDISAGQAVALVRDESGRGFVYRLMPEGHDYDDPSVAAAANAAATDDKVARRAMADLRRMTSGLGLPVTGTPHVTVTAKDFGSDAELIFLRELESGLSDNDAERVSRAKWALALVRRAGV